MFIVKVLPLSKSARTDVLSYFSPTALPLGTLVDIPFRTKKILALVTDCHDARDMKSEIKEASYTLKRIEKIHAGNIFSPAFLSTCREIAEHYLLPVSYVFGELAPKIIFEESFLKHAEENLLKKVEREHAEKYIFQAPFEDRLSWYKTRIRESFSQKKSVLFILPTEHDIALYSDILSRGIAEHTVVLHGGLTPKEQRVQTEKILTEAHPVLIIGTPGCIAIPRPDIRTVVLEHESAQAYRLIHSPYLDTRLAVELFANESGHEFVIADTLVRVETYERYKRSELTEVSPLTFHPHKPAEEKLVTRESKNEGKAFKSIGTELEKSIRQVHTRGSRMFLFTLRNGLATITVCRDCGETLTCEYCHAPLVLYRASSKRIFICNTCKRHTPSDSACPTCASWNLFPHGVGIDSVFDECAKNFPDIPTFRIDRASIKSPKQAREIAQKWSTTPGALLIGTEMALHYIEGSVPSIGVVSFDSLFSIPSFRVSERIVELVTTLRERAEQSLIIQTLYPDNKLLSIMGRPALLSWFEEELEERKQFRYPPTSTLIKIVGHVALESVTLERARLALMLERYEPDIFVGPSEEHKNKQKLVALLRVPKHSWWIPKLSRGSGHDEALAGILREVIPEYRVLINPEDLL